MSNFGFGEDDGLTEPQGQGEKEPAWFRSRMDKVSEQMKALQERNDALETAQRHTQVAEALKAKGYATTAAELFKGKPEELTDWLGTYGAALAKTDGTAVETGQGVQSTQTVVSIESQAAMQTMASAGVDGAASALSGEDQLLARINAANTEEEFNAVMREAGNIRF